jgi:hypothetical protein
MSLFLVFVSFSSLYFFSAALAEFSEMVCEPSQKTSSQLDLGNFCNATNLSSEYLLSAGSAQFAYNLPEQAPGHLFDLSETIREIHPMRKDVQGHLGSTLGPQFTRAISYSTMSLPGGELVWNDGQHVVGEISYTPGGYAEGFLVPSKTIGELPGIPHRTGNIAKPTELRRFVKLFKRAAPATCVTYALDRCL